MAHTPDSTEASLGSDFEARAGRGASFRLTHLEGVDARGRGAATQPDLEGVHGVLRTLQTGLDAPVRQVPDPPTNPQRAGLALRRPAKADALDAPGDDDVTVNDRHAELAGLRDPATSLADLTP